MAVRPFAKLKLLRSQLWWWAVLAAVLVSLTPVAALAPKSPGAVVQALVAFGPRVAGTKAAEQASTYLLSAYREAGYEAEVQTFSYSKFFDRGSSLTVGSTKIEGRALSGSKAGNPTAPLVVVPNVGRPEDFAAVGVRGAIAIVRRGEIRFLEKARNAEKAGAVGLVIVNSAPGELMGALGGEVNIPVLGLSGKQGTPLLERAQTVRQQVRLNVSTSVRTVTGRNVIAKKPGVNQPRVLLGGHYDSVAGSPGANDNASGTAVVLELARRLGNTPLARQAWFVAFDGEEDGLHGSKAFVKKAAPEFFKSFRGMLNFDMVGVNDKLLVGGTESLTKLAQKIDPAVSTFPDNGLSDHQSFSEAGVPVIFFYRGDDPNYHSPGDKKVDPKLLDATVRVALEVVKRL